MASRFVLLVIVGLRCATAFAAGPIAGIDHMPFAVRDLERAQAAFRDLGFAIKPGRVHDDGIRNAHVKFPDGSGIELITVSAAVDALTTRYVQLLDQGEGPAFFALHVRDVGKLRAAFKAAGIPFAEPPDDTAHVPLPGLDWLFFVGDNRSPTDRPEHFAHPNGATALSRVWLAPDDPAPLRRVLLALGARIERAKVAAPDPVDAEVARLDNGQLLILPADSQLIPSRPIIGATFTARRAQPPVRVMGMWIEFRSPSQ